MNVVPVSLPSSHGGLAESHGLLRDEGEELVLEYSTRDSMFGVLESVVKAARIPRGALASVTLRTLWFGLGGSRIEIQTTHLEPLAGVPGMSQGRVYLSVARSQMDAARKFVDDLRLPTSAPAKPQVPGSDFA